LDPLFEWDQEGSPGEEVPPGPRVLERPDRKAFIKRMSREVELRKRVRMCWDARGQRGDARVGVKVRQMYTKLRGSASH